MPNATSTMSGATAATRGTTSASSSARPAWVPAMRRSGCRARSDRRDLTVAAAEHHELGVRGDDEGALARIETLLDLSDGIDERDTIEADAEDVDAAPHA